MAPGSFDALVTTDGDADRPLVADGTGRILRGDVLGLITARYLDADTVVVPVTAGSALEQSGGFRTVVRTKDDRFADVQGSDCSPSGQGTSCLNAIHSL